MEAVMTSIRSHGARFGPETSVLGLSVVLGYMGPKFP